MNKELIMNETENDDEVTVTYLEPCEERECTAAEKAIGATILTLAVLETINIGKKVFGWCKKASAKRKAKKIREAQFSEIENVECDVEEESD